MEIDRRTFLALGGAAVLTSADGSVAATEEGPLYLGARLNAGAYEAALIDSAGKDRLVLPLEGRGHSFAIDAPRRQAVAFARAPGRFAIAFQIDGKGAPQAFAPPADRHFYGHGAFTPDGRLLLATENDFGGARGVTGIYDVEAGYRRIGEFASGGIGPHEVILLKDGRTLCVANGGILTHPDYQRVKLNLAIMKPNLAYIDSRDGALVDRVELEPALHQISIRHLALDGGGHVWFGGQYQGEDGATPPLVGRHRRGRPVELFPAPAEIQTRLENYVGSVAVDSSGELVATTSPRGGVTVFWDAATGRCLGARSLADGCGIAPSSKHRFMESSGRGAVVVTGPEGTLQWLRRPASDMPAWDNHLRRI